MSIFRNRPSNTSSWQNWGNFAICRGLSDFADDANEQHLRAVEDILSAQTESIHPNHLVLRNKTACPIMDLPDEVLFRIIEQVQYTETNWENMMAVNKRFRGLVDDEPTAYHTVRTQFSPYAQLMERKRRYLIAQNLQTFCVLDGIYTMYRYDYVAIGHMQQMTGHTQQVCMSLMVFLKTIQAGMPPADPSRGRSDTDQILERKRSSLHKVRIARSHLTPDLLLLLRYTVEVVRQMIGKHPTAPNRPGWMTDGPPRDFSFHAMFEDSLLRFHELNVWDSRVLETTILWDQFEKLDMLAKMFERQEHFLALDLDNNGDDLMWITMVAIHHSTGQALWSELTKDEQKLVEGQSRFLASQVAIELFPTESSRIDKVNVVHQFLMDKIMKKFGDAKYTKQMTDNLDLDNIREVLDRGKEKIWAMNLEEVEQAIAQEIEVSDLKVWRARPQTVQ